MLPLRFSIIPLTLLCSPVFCQESADAYPSRAVTIVIPYAAGGPNDFEARLYATKLAASMGQQFLLDFKPGAGGAIGNAYVAKAKPDGYTLLVVAGGFTLLPAFSKNLPYNTVADFAPVSLMSRRASALVANPSFSANSLRDYIAYAKASPGKINFGTTGVGSTPHLAGVWMHNVTNTKVTFVHYKGTGPMMAELAGGQIDIAPIGLLSVLPLIKSGKLRPLAILEEKRSMLLADLPTAQEQGVAGLNGLVWLGISVPTATPQALVAKLSDELIKVARTPDVISTLEAGGSTLVGSTPAQFRQLIVSETARWQKVVRDAGIKVDD